MDKTRVIYPIAKDKELSKDEQKNIRDFIKKMKEVLDKNTINTFDEFLIEMNCDLDRYIFILSTQIESNKIFLKRSPKVSFL